MAVMGNKPPKAHNAPPPPSNNNQVYQFVDWNPTSQFQQRGKSAQSANRQQQQQQRSLPPPHYPPPGTQFINLFPRTSPQMPLPPQMPTPTATPTPISIPTPTRDHVQPTLFTPVPAPVPAPVPTTTPAPTPAPVRQQTVTSASPAAVATTQDQNLIVISSDEEDNDDVKFVMEGSPVAGKRKKGKTVDDPISLDDEEDDIIVNDAQAQERQRQQQQHQKQEPVAKEEGTINKASRQQSQSMIQHLPLQPGQPRPQIQQQQQRASSASSSSNQILAQQILAQSILKPRMTIHQLPKNQATLQISKQGEITVQNLNKPHITRKRQHSSEQSTSSIDVIQSAPTATIPRSEVLATGLQSQVIPSSPLPQPSKEPMDQDPAEDDDDDDNSSISSSELLFGAKPVTTETDFGILDAMVAPDEEDDAPPDWSQLIHDVDIKDEDLTMNSGAYGDSMDQMHQDKAKEPSMQTNLPNNVNLDVLLSMIEAYDVSVMGPLEASALDTTVKENSGINEHQQQHPPAKLTRTRTRYAGKRRSQTPSLVAEQQTLKPYVPCSVWDHATWEDWAQMEIGDWLHWPFEEWEIEFIESMMEHYTAKAKKRQADGLDIDGRNVWESIALKLTRRRAVDCARFWDDREKGHQQMYKTPVIISCKPRNTKRPSVYKLVKGSRYHGRSRTNMSKVALWPELKYEHTFGEGSADTLAVHILNRKGKSIKIIAASACNDQPEYNMPGNLRIWSASKRRVSQLKGHKTLHNGQDVWHTVTDVRASTDQRLFFTSSHDTTAKVWCGYTGRMLSTLCYHEKKVHQLAVSPDKQKYIIATGSGDGAAVIWTLNGLGNVGDGTVCIPDKRLTKNPSIDTLVFGRGPSENMLYTGVSSGLTSPMGFIQGFDTRRGQTAIYYKNMNGAVCDIDISETGRFVVSGNHSPFEEYEGDGYVHLNDTRTPESVIKARTGHPDVNLVRMR
ncbi:hypothetical protein BDB00DRAFT_411581 [Zychaea mexicana]|uniref:uncharacterized protein n=1 Tax=Zychaea mexicana TaxID=64656 RepID=UPI0022FDC051|nr:uncharacterized protein BDB00DRAFT_411581 [Zychaea mexicana]KAI9492869.1 hypothetical protein BDB00DRAFT_411581 [Zychaea mexicana]